ncbi:MAG: bifunctional ADP-heptose synthase [Cytophagales bacterium]|nr:bifunctional ADP-heptose synthase [Cytophagales bacterium]
MKHYKNIQEIISAFADLHVLVIGDVMLDAYHWGKVERISPEAPVPVVSLSKKENRPGGAANVALNVIALGAKATICSVIGYDTEGDEFIHLLQHSGISAEGIVRSSSRPTTTKTRILSGHQQILRIDHETDSYISDSENNLLFEKIKQLSQGCHVVIFEDYDKGVINASLILKCISYFTSLQIPVCVDPKKRNFMHYKGATLFKPNLKELKEGLKKDWESGQDTELLSAVNELDQIIHAHKYLITLSEKGVLIKNSTHTHIVPAHIREIADVSGAGDTVISVAALCVALNLEDKTMAEIANIAGGLVCEHLGVVPINLAELTEECVRLGVCTY